jgi:hypothetical protein
MSGFISLLGRCCQFVVAQCLSQEIDGVHAGDHRSDRHIARGRHVKASLPNDQTLLYSDVQKQWDAGDWP